MFSGIRAQYSHFKPKFIVIYRCTFCSFFSHACLELYISNVTSFYDIFRVTIKETISLLRNVFDDFDHIPILHRTTLFKNFLGKFCMLECVYLGTKYFKNEFHYMASLLTMVDVRNVEGWVAEEDNIERKEDFRTSLKAFSKDYSNLLIPMHKMDDMTDREFHALLAYAYADVGHCDLPEEIFRSANVMKARIFGELQDYYRSDLKLVDFSQRLGNLMTIAHGAGEAGNIMNEEMRMYSAMFGVYSEDQLFREIFIE